jgi:lipid A 3-O-deacylase
MADELLTDLRFGVLAHDVPVLADQREHGADLNAEAIFASPVPGAALTDVAPGWRWLLRPAPDIGIEANTNGYTSQVYVGLTWTADLDTGGVLWPDHAVFVAIGIGPAFNNGHVHTTEGNRLSLGSNVLFHPSLEVGYRITQVWSLSVYFDHSSNGGLARDNAGLDNLGVRLGLHF